MDTDKPVAFVAYGTARQNSIHLLHTVLRIGDGRPVQDLTGWTACFGGRGETTGDCRCCSHRTVQ
jgi:hypothetical protein